jgi:hypothetical protein
MQRACKQNHALVENPPLRMSSEHRVGPACKGWKRMQKQMGKCELCVCAAHLERHNNGRAWCVWLALPLLAARVYDKILGFFILFGLSPNMAMRVMVCARGEIVRCLARIPGLDAMAIVVGRRTRRVTKIVWRWACATCMLQNFRRELRACECTAMSTRGALLTFAMAAMRMVCAACLGHLCGPMCAVSKSHIHSVPRCLVFFGIAHVVVKICVLATFHAWFTASACFKASTGCCCKRPSSGVSVF